MSPEIVEIGDDSKTITASRDGSDVYVAVGKDDIDVLKWALEHAVSPGFCVFLVHVFPPINYVSTPVGRVAKSQLSEEQVRVYMNEDNNRRRNLLQKYIRLCSDANVTVETMLLESKGTAKAVLELIPVLNITHLVMGTKHPLSSSRRLRKKSNGEYVKNNAPDFCEVTIVYGGNKVVHGQQAKGLLDSPLPSSASQPKKKTFTCVSCFSGRFV